MKEKNFKKFMKVLALFNIFIFLYPDFLVLRYFIFGTMGGILEVFLSLFSLYLGFAGTAFICKREYYFTTRLLSYAAVLIPAGICGFIYSETGIRRSIGEILPAVVFYIIGSINFRKDYSNIFSQASLFAGGFILSALLIMTNISDVLKPARIIVLLFILIYILITMLIKSYENIDQVFMFRGVELPEVQKSIRKQNTKLIILLYAGILILFNIKDLLAAVLKFILIVYIKASLFIMYILSILLEAGTGEAAKGTAQKQPPPLAAGEPNRLMDYLFMAITAIMIIYAAYKGIPKLIKVIWKLAAFIKDKLSRVIRLKENNDYNDEECVEIVEITKKIVNNKVQKKKKANLFAILKKAAEPAERIRLMYEIILNELSKKGVDLAVSDTTGQIIKKSAAVESVKNEIENITSIYEQVRYGEEIPKAESLKDMEKGYRNILGRK